VQFARFDAGSHRLDPTVHGSVHRVAVAASGTFGGSDDPAELPINGAGGCRLAGIDLATRFQ
jgi:hypothetical protein